MPPRTNSFQRLVAIVHAHLTPTWSVTESRMLMDSVTKSMREVDIVAESTVTGYPLVISVECRDHARSADVRWVEEMATKHAHLATSKLVLWSASGFSKAAERKAAALKIETVSQRDALRTDWQNLAQQLVNGSVRYLSPRFESAVDIVTPDGIEERIPAQAQLALQPIHTLGHVTLEALLHHMRSLPDLATVLLDHAPVGSGTFHMVYEPPAPCDLLDGEIRLGRVTRVLAEIRSDVQVGALKSRSVHHREELFTLARAELSQGDFELRVVETRGTAPDVCAQYRPNRFPS
jgi:hypothetical protein